MKQKKYALFGCIALYALLCIIYALANSEGFCLRDGHCMSLAEKKEIMLNRILLENYPDSLPVYKKLRDDVPDADKFLESYYRQNTDERIVYFEGLVNGKSFLVHHRGTAIDRLTGTASQEITLVIRSKKTVNDKVIFKEYKQIFYNCPEQKGDSNFFLEWIKIPLNIGVYFIYFLFWCPVRPLKHLHRSTELIIFIMLANILIWLIYQSVIKKHKWRVFFIFIAFILWLYLILAGMMA